MDDMINRSQIRFSKDELKKMSPEDRKIFARSIILKVVRDNPQGISLPQVSDIAGIDRRTASKHLDYLTAIRELYKRQLSQRNIIYYPNGKVAHPSLTRDIKLGDKYYNFQLIENPFGKFVYIQEKTRDEYLKNKGLKILRFFNNEIARNLDDVLKSIWAEVGNEL